MSDKQDLVAVGRNSVFLQIKEVLISDLKPRSRNARIHPDKQIFMLAQYRYVWLSGTMRNRREKSAFDRCRTGYGGRATWHEDSPGDPGQPSQRR